MESLTKVSAVSDKLHDVLQWLPLCPFLCLFTNLDVGVW